MNYELMRAVLQMVMAERLAQHEKHGDAMKHLPDGVGPNVRWLANTAMGGDLDFLSAQEIQKAFRRDYEYASRERGDLSAYPLLTRMHLVREEIAEAFECDPDSPEFILELIQVAALCVQWVEYKIEGQS